MPLEVKRLIYQKYFEVNEQASCAFGTPSCIDVNLLSTNRQIREKALEILPKSNRWIAVAHYIASDAAVPLPPTDFVPFEVPQRRFSKPIIADLLASPTFLFTARLGHGCDVSRPLRARRIRHSIFAFNRSTSFALCASWAANVPQWPNFSFDITPRYHNEVADLLPDFILYIAMIRNASAVDFTQLTHPILNHIARTIIKPTGRPERWHELLYGLKEEGNHAYNEDRLDDACMFYSEAAMMSQRCITEWTGPVVGARDRICQISNGCFSKNNSVFDRIATYGALLAKGWNWPWMSNDQRRRRHMHQARRWHF